LKHGTEKLHRFCTWQLRCYRRDTALT
jgi:hypothetical protein